MSFLYLGRLAYITMIEHSFAAWKVAFATLFSITSLASFIAFFPSYQKRGEANFS